MKILHVSPHLGGGVGTVLKGWNNKEKLNIACLEQTNDPRTRDLGTVVSRENLMVMIEDSDIVLVHFWDHKTIFELFSQRIPKCRLIFWSHKNWNVPDKWKNFPDMFFNTSPVQGNWDWIWSTGGLRPLARVWNPVRFNIGTVVSRKTDLPLLVEVVQALKKEIPSAVFTWIGGSIPDTFHPSSFHVGVVNDIYPYFKEMDVFLYPLKKDHYGTCEQVLGEAMSAGVVPVVMGNRAEHFIVDDGNNGFTIDNKDDAVTSIRYLYNEPDARQEMAHTARVDAQHLYDIDLMIKRWSEKFVGVNRIINKHHQGVIV
jgi:hypothetical protein